MAEDSSIFLAVITVPPKNNDDLMDNESLRILRNVVEEMGSQSLCVREYGDNENHPHLNVVVRCNKIYTDTSTLRKKLRRWYLNQNIECGKYALRCEFAKPNVLEYLAKEKKAQLVWKSGCYESYNLEEYYGKYVRKSKSANPDKLWQYLTKNEFLDFAHRYLIDKDLYIGTYEDFAHLMLLLKHDRIVCWEVMQRPSHFYSLLALNEYGDDNFLKIINTNGNLT